MARRPYFTRDLFRFLTDLKKNNDRDWFKAHRDRYEEAVKAPMLAFIEDLAPAMAKVSEHVVVSAKPVGGSMFRIHRDTRFSKDKSPYKTHAAMQFRHVAGKDVHAPGFYLHLEPGDVFMGGGMWHPDNKALTSIRTRLADDPDAWKKVTRSKTFRDSFALYGGSLKRPPRGFDADHSFVEDLKRKDFIAVSSFDPDAPLDAGFMADFTKRCRRAAPFMRWLCDAVDLGF
ncbi:MAG: DUF2461 domain-containing protein [Myxococcota bacterium]